MKKEESDNQPQLPRFPTHPLAPRVKRILRIHRFGMLNPKMWIVVGVSAVAVGISTASIATRIKADAFDKECRKWDFDGVADRSDPINCSIRYIDEGGKKMILTADFDSAPLMLPATQKIQALRRSGKPIPPLDQLPITSRWVKQANL